MLANEVSVSKESEVLTKDKWEEDAAATARLCALGRIV